MAIILILSICFILLVILLILRIRHRCLRKKNNLYYKCSQWINSTNGSAVEKDPNQNTRKNPYDDLSPVESYLYPITSTSSLINPSSPSSLFKNEQYAIIDGNAYTHLPTNNVKQRCNRDYAILCFLLDISLRITGHRSSSFEISHALWLYCTTRKHSIESSGYTSTVYWRIETVHSMQNIRIKIKTFGQSGQSPSRRAHQLRHLGQLTRLTPSTNNGLEQA